MTPIQAAELAWAHGCTLEISDGTLRVVVSQEPMSAVRDMLPAVCAANEAIHAAVMACQIALARARRGLT